MAGVYQQLATVQDSVYASFKKANQAIATLLTSNYRCVSGATFSTKTGTLTGYMKKAYSALTYARDYYKAMTNQQTTGLVNPLVTAMNLTIYATQAKSSEIYISYSEAQENVKTLKSAETALIENVKTIYSIKSSIGAMTYTEDSDSIYGDFIRLVDSTLGLSEKKFQKNQNDAMEALTTAANSIGLVHSALNYQASVINTRLAEFQKADTAMQKSITSMKAKLKISASQKYTESNASANRDAINDQIDELEALQAEYTAAHGEASQEIADEIARLKKLLGAECDVPLYGQQTHYTCGSASGSMILNSLGVNVSESEFWDYANSNDQGTYVYRVTQTLNHFYGEDVYSYVNTSSMSLNEYAELISNSIKNGYPVQVVLKIPSGTDFGYSSNGHYVVITGIYQNADGEYIVKINDPYSKNGTNSPQQLEMKLSDIKKYNKNHSGYVICNK